MGNPFYHQEDSSGYQKNSNYNSEKDNSYSKDQGKRPRDRDDDLIIEDNTIYEIDRECYERLKKQKKRRV